MKKTLKLLLLLVAVALLRPDFELVVLVVVVAR